MNIFESVVLGIIEGITEFLPVSSTAHLILSSQFLGIEQSEFLKLYEVVIQTGAVLAIVALYFAYVLKHREIVPKILVSFVPTAAVGFLLHDVIKGVFFESNAIIIAALALVGFIFVFIEYLIKTKRLTLAKDLKSMTLQGAFLVGLIQAVAVVPGVSRAGAVIVGMMLMRYKRSDAALYSFLLAVPTIAAAGVFDLIKTRGEVFASIDNIVLISFGFITSFIVALFAVRWLVGYLQRHTLTAFGIYRIILAVMLFLLFR